MQIHLKLFLLFLFISNTTFANTYLDDLRKQLNTAADSTKAELYLDLSDKYYNQQNTDSAIFYAREALLLSKLNKNQELIFTSYLELYYNYLLVHDYELAKISLDYAKDISYKSKDSTKICDVHLKLAYYFAVVSKYDSAIFHHNTSIELCDLLDDKRQKVNNLIGLGEIYYERGELELSLNKYLEAFKFTEVFKDDQIKLSLLINMGNIYSSENQIEQAKDYYNQAKKIAEKLKDEDVLSVLYNNLAILYQEELDFKKAQTYFEKSLNIDKKKDDKAGMALCLNNIGENYFKMGNNEKAIIYFRESLSSNRKLKLETAIIYNLESLAQIHLSNGNFKQAYGALAEGIKISEEVKAKGKRADLLLLLANYYNKIGNNKNAYSSMVVYNSLKDSLQNESRTEKMVQLRTKFEAEQKEKENEILRVKNQFTQEKLEQEKLRANYLFIFSFLAIVVIVLIFMLFRSKVKINNRINVINGKLEESNSKLEIINATKDKFFSIISHDLRSPFNPILGFSELIKTELKTTKDLAVLEEYNSSVSESAQNLFTLLENLLQWANSQRGELEFSPVQFDLYELVQSNLNLFKLKTADKSIKLSSDIKPNTLAYGDLNMVNTIVRNLISNALKFTEPNGEVSLSAKHENDFILLSIRDTGIGITKENQEKLFKLDCNFTTYGTGDESGSGLGLILCKEFVNKNGGEIWVESQIDKGSNFIFSLKSA
ncbi:tetratricopeptide repeat protein [Ancylomarina sp.]|uniref:tetratricopeptide repeat-containing sensor histidine kinase n=1 Tax=Ancylomarina sp. TaxID=1970196 RepID=UPI003569B5FC